MSCQMTLPDRWDLECVPFYWIYWDGWRKAIPQIIQPHAMNGFIGDNQPFELYPEAHWKPMQLMKQSLLLEKQEKIVRQKPGNVKRIKSLFLAIYSCLVKPILFYSNQNGARLLVFKNRPLKES